MTRINIISPSELTDKHLVSEYHELPRIFTLVRNAIKRGDVSDFYRERYPDYTMGVGHVKFFYGRLHFLSERFIELVVEMQKRKMRPNISDFEKFISGIPKDWFGEWSPDESAIELNRKRIAERIIEAKERKKRKALTPYNMDKMDENGEIRD